MYCNGEIEEKILGGGKEGMKERGCDVWFEYEVIWK